jgi:CrcB protein
MDKAILVFIGGGIGAMARYGTALLAARLFGTAFPWGTLIVNLAGCFLIGLLLALAERTALIGPGARLFLVTGFLGGLTTFSTYGMESAQAARSGEPALMLYNIMANNVGGLVLVVLGMMTVRLIK